MSYITFFENLAVQVPTADGRPSLSVGLLYRPMHDGALEDFFIGVNHIYIYIYRYELELSAR